MWELSLRYVPPEEDFWKVYDEAKGQGRIMLLAYLHLAARRGELFNLRWDDVNFREQTIRLTTRNRESGNLEYDERPMTEELYETMLRFKGNNDEEWVFLNPITKKPFLQRRRLA